MIYFLLLLEDSWTLFGTDVILAGHSVAVDRYHPSFIQNLASSTAALRFHLAQPGDGPMRNASMGFSYKCSDDWRTKVLAPPFRGRGILILPHL
jgi:hypothetical protein